MFQRILVPLDGSTRAERASPVAARLARASGGSIMLLEVAPTATHCELKEEGKATSSLHRSGGFARRFCDNWP